MVSRVRFKLHEKGPNLLNLARLMDWIDEPDETGGLAERLRKMTPEQRAENAPIGRTDSPTVDRGRAPTAG